MDLIPTIRNAIQQVFRIKRNYLLFGVFASIIFFIVVIIPVMAIPGNDILFQLSIMPVRDYIILITIALLSALMVTMHSFLFSRDRTIHNASGLTATGLMGVGAALVSLTTCISCASTVIGFVGVSALGFLHDYRFLVSVVSLGILLFALYHTSRRVTGYCNACNSIGLRKGTRGKKTER